MEVNCLRSDSVHLSLGESQQLKRPQGDPLRSFGNRSSGDQCANLRPVPAMTMFLAVRVFVQVLVLTVMVGRSGLIMMVMIVPVVIMMIVRVRMRAVGMHVLAPLCWLAILQDIDLGSSNPAAIHGMDLQLCANPQPRCRILQQLRRHACPNQCPQHHVPGNPGKAFDFPNRHRFFRDPRVLAPSISAGSSSFIDPER